MAQMSISEALAEIKLIDKKVEKKRENILTHSSRFEHILDPYPAETGGSSGFIRRELQAVEDLLKQRVKIRHSISKANLETLVTVEAHTLPLTSWLIWKREVGTQQRIALQTLKNLIEKRLAENSTRPQLLKKEDGSDPVLTKLISHVDLTHLQKEIEQIMTIEERLDGILSMKNAQIMIDI